MTLPNKIGAANSAPRLQFYCFGFSIHFVADCAAFTGAVADLARYATMRLLAFILLFVFGCNSSSAVTPDPLACFNNISQLDGAKHQLQVEQDLQSGTVVEPDMLTPYIRGGFPVCPSGGVYTIGPIGSHSVCSLADHSEAAVHRLIANPAKPSSTWLTFFWRSVLFGGVFCGVFLIYRRVTNRLQARPGSRLG